MIKYWYIFYYYSGATLFTWKGEEKSILFRINPAPAAALDNENHYRYGLLIPQMAGISAGR